VERNAKMCKPRVPLKEKGMTVSREGRGDRAQRLSKQQDERREKKPNVGYILGVGETGRFDNRAPIVSTKHR